MPITPKYHRQARLPGTLGAPSASVEAFTTTERAMTDLGRVVEARGFQLKQQYDESKIAAGYNEFRDIARTKLSELLSLQGENATGLGNKYDQWYGDFYSDYINKRFSNATQQEGWKSLVETRRGHDLDILARHEAQEIARFREQSEAALFTAITNDINSNPWDGRAFETSYSNFTATLERLHPGENIGALKDKYEKEIYFGRLQSMINDNPTKAAPYLEQFKDIIGPEAYKRLKAQLETGINDQKVEAAYRELETMFGTDPKKKLNFLRSTKNWDKLGVDLGQVKELRSIYGAEANNDKVALQEYEKNRDEGDLKNWQDAYYKRKNVKEAWNIADKMQNIDLRGRALALLEKAQFESDPEMYFELQRKINMDPGNMNVTKIWMYAPSAVGEKGVNGDHLQAFQQRWESLMRERTEKPDKYALRQRFLHMADRMAAERVYSLESSRENWVIWGRVVEEMNDMFDANPDITDKQMEDWFIRRHAEYKNGRTMWLINQILGIFGKSVGETGDILESDLLLKDEAVRQLIEQKQRLTPENIDEAIRQLKEGEAVELKPAH